MFSPHYHETGFAVAANSPDGNAYVDEEELSGDVSEYVPLNNAVDFRDIMPEGVLQGDFPGWKGYYRKGDGGWAHARKACVSASTEAVRLGVRAICGTPQGEVASLMYGPDGDVVGVKTADSKAHHADRVILTAGAGANELLDFKDQLRPTAWTLMHLRLTPEEAEMYRYIPVLFNIEKGFFLEPDEDAHEMKICDEHPGYLNFVSDGPYGRSRSVPFARHQVPREAELRARQLLRETMPQLAERPFSFARVCWCADTVDRMFLIDTHPASPSLVLGVGGSGHGFSCIPAIGGLIADKLEGKLNAKLSEAFRWRPETAVDRDWKALQGRWGAERKIMDFRDVTEWTNIEPQDTSNTPEGDKSRL